MNKKHVVDVLEQIENLPTLPVVAQQILKIIGNQRSNMGQIADVITKDQAISARVIRLTNSAFYGLPHHITSIQHAIVILGLNTVKNLVLGISVVKTFQDTRQASIFDREQFWLHTFSTALGSKLMAKRLSLANEEDYFLAGLLHDIGILAIDQFLHNEFMEILKHCLTKGTDYLKSELDILGLGHNDVGRFLANKWGLPEFLANTIQYHHDPEKIPDAIREYGDIISVVHIADAQARKEKIGTFIENFDAPFTKVILKRINIPETELAAIFEQVRQEAKALMKEWGL